MRIIFLLPLLITASCRPINHPKHSFMFDTRLNDFELDQLDLFLAMTEDKLSLLQNAINRAEESPESNLRTALLDLYARQQASLTLLQVQLENAKLDVKQLAHSN